MVRPLRHLAAFMIGTAALAVSCALPALAQQGGVTPFGRAKEERIKAMATLPNWSGSKEKPDRLKKDIGPI